MAKTARKTAGAAKKRKTTRREWTATHKKELRQHSKSKTPVDKIAKVMKRTAGAIRQKAMTLGIPIGHRR
jgi:hypothetical protein